MDIGKSWQLFFDDWKQVILYPEIFFEKLIPDEFEESDNSLKPVLFFTITCGVLSGIIKTLLTFGDAAFAIIAYPLIFVSGTIIGGAALFLASKLYGGKGDIETAIKMVGYTHSVSVLSFGIPIMGSLFVFYHFWLLIVGTKVIHWLDNRSALFVVLLPLVLFVLLVLLITTISGVNIFADVLSHKGKIL